MEPSSRLASEALVVSCAVCAVPSAVWSIVEGSWGTVFSFMVVAILHGIIIGVPAYWVLVWRKAANAFTCTMTGLMVGTLPYIVIFMPGMSGPGVNHPRTVVFMAMSGAAIGFVFWFYITKRMKNQNRFLDTFS